MEKHRLGSCCRTRSECHCPHSDPDAGRTLGREVSIQGMAARCLLAMGGDRALAVRRGEAAKAPPRSKVSLQALQARGVRTPRGNGAWAPAQVARLLA